MQGFVLRIISVIWRPCLSVGPRMPGELHWCSIAPKHLNRAGEHELSVDTMLGAIRVMWWFIGREISILGTSEENELENEELKAVYIITCMKMDLRRRMPWLGLKYSPWRTVTC